MNKKLLLIGVVIFVGVTLVLGILTLLKQQSQKTEEHNTISSGKKTATLSFLPPTVPLPTGNSEKHSVGLILASQEDVGVIKIGMKFNPAVVSNIQVIPEPYTDQTKRPFTPLTKTVDTKKGVITLAFMKNKAVTVELPKAVRIAKINFTLRKTTSTAPVFSFLPSTDVQKYVETQPKAELLVDKINQDKALSILSGVSPLLLIKNTTQTPVSTR